MREFTYIYPSNTKCDIINIFISSIEIVLDEGWQGTGVVYFPSDSSKHLREQYQDVNLLGQVDSFYHRHHHDTGDMGHIIRCPYEATSTGWSREVVCIYSTVSLYLVVYFNLLEESADSSKPRQHAGYFVATDGTLR